MVYEYMVVQLTHDGRHDAQLNPLGAQGWLLVGVTGYLAYLARDITPPVDPPPLRKE